MGKWQRFSKKPLFGEGVGTWFDVSILKDNLKYRLYVSRRQSRTVMLSFSDDGINFSEAVSVIKAPESEFECYNRACVLLDSEGFYRMYLTKQYNPPELIGAYSEIYVGLSSDGLNWEEPFKKVISADCEWEKCAVMCPHVMWDEEELCYKMWYSGGEQYEPDAIGYAISKDGFVWEKYKENPVFKANSDIEWEQYKVTACQVLKESSGYRMYYTGFRDIDTAGIGSAFSKNGITDWVRDKENPIVEPNCNVWDCSACYKPFYIEVKGKKRVYYNGRRDAEECVCMAELCENCNINKEEVY